MLEKTYSKAAWIEALRKLRDSYQILVPVKEGDFHLFKPLDGAKAPDFIYQNTRLSPKGVVYPQSERMFEVKLDEKDPEANIYREPVKPSAFRFMLGDNSEVGIRW